MSELAENRYQVVDVLGRGGMATVYRAYDSAAAMNVALKVLHGHLAGDDGIVEAFEREAALMQGIDHRGVVRVFAVTEHEGRPAIAMEHCPGGDLRQRLLAEGPMPEDQAVELFDKILEALDAIHTSGVLHRDIKPQNIVFDEGGEPKLIDFGIGQAQELMEADESGQIGTVEYMAPERIDGCAVDGRSDLYSAAVTFFEMVCGHVPFRADSAAAVMRMHREATVPDPQLFAPDLSDRSSRVIERGLAKIPEQRYDSARRMRAALRGDEPETTAIEEHPRWRQLVHQFEASTWMAAPIAEEGYEWIVFSADHWEEGTKNLERLIRATRELIDDYESYLTVEPTPPFGSKRRRSLVDRIYWAAVEVWRTHILGGGKYILLHGTKDPEIRAVNYQLDPSRRLVIARGLSRRGADELLERLEDRGARARYAQLPRSGENTGEYSHLLQTSHLPVLLYAGVIGLAAGYLPFLASVDGTPGSILIFGPAFILAIMLGFLVGVGPALLTRQDGRNPGQALFDFSRVSHGDDRGEMIRMDHLQLAGAVESPRVRASLQRALNLSLHLRDFLDENSRDGVEKIEQIVRGLTELTRRIAELEYRVAAIRPSRLASRIRHIDLRIADEDDLRAVEELMEKKAALRDQLRRRDDQQLELESLTQKLLDLAARLEEMVRLVGDSEDEATEQLVDEEDGEVVLELDDVSAEIERLSVESAPT